MASVFELPVDRRKRTARHPQATRHDNRQFAVQQNAVTGHIEIGGAGETSGNAILASLSASEREAHPTLTKKEKQQMRHDALMQRLGGSSSPYSKSTMRRIKRKDKETLSTDLTAVGEAIAAVEAQGAPQNEIHKGREARPKPGQIGEGKHTSLTTNQRKGTFKAEKLRHRLIMQDPNFSSNPFQTIRTHAQNTLLKH
ncbi:ribosome biogenesis protein SLX9-domain-containing protein [Hysterangium stoloniferum]|nr:ribosome biogenesis protein SLX9-domain-containing protein [Hysterangium stoloniferum]